MKQIISNLNPNSFLFIERERNKFLTRIYIIIQAIYFATLPLLILNLFSFPSIDCQQLFPNNQFNRVRLWRIEELIPATYNNQQPPNLNQSSAVIVDVFAQIDNIRFKSDLDKSNDANLLVDVHLTQSWTDERLLIPAALQLNPQPKITLDYRWKQALWTPLLQFTNAKQTQLNTFFEPLIYIEINNQKKVQLNAKLTLELNCDYRVTKHQHAQNQPENLGKETGSFPFDSKECGIELITLSSTLDMISLRWANFDLLVDQTRNFKIDSSRSEHCVRMFNSGSFSCLRARFTLKRKFWTAFSTHMLPAILFVFICYLTFWMPSMALSNNDNSSLSNQIIHSRTLLLVFAISGFYIKHNIENHPPLLVDQNSSNNLYTSLTIWHLANLLFALLALIELLLFLHQTQIRCYLLTKMNSFQEETSQLDQQSASDQAKSFTNMAENSNLNKSNLDSDSLKNDKIIQVHSNNYLQANSFEIEYLDANKSKREILLSKILGLKQVQPKNLNLKKQVNNQLNDKLTNQFTNQLDDQLNNQLNNQSYSKSNDQPAGQSNDQLNEQTINQFNKQKSQNKQTNINNLYLQKKISYLEIDWLDKLFRIIYPILYAIFFLLFLLCCLF